MRWRRGLKEDGRGKGLGVKILWVVKDYSSFYIKCRFATQVHCRFFGRVLARGKNALAKV